MYSKPEYKVIKIGMKYVVVHSEYSSKSVHHIYDLSNFYYSYFKSNSDQVCYLLNRASSDGWMAHSLNEYYSIAASAQKDKLVVE